MTKKITSRFITSFAMKKKFLPLIVMLSMSSLKTTGHELDPTSHQANIVPSAEAWAMSRYGNPTPSLYTGAMSYSVPIYTYKDPDFTIPISLDYHFDGYKLTARSGSVGMGWFLNCGGIITREVVGLPDETELAVEIPNSNIQNYVSGYYFLYKGESSVSSLSNSTGYDISQFENSFYSGDENFVLLGSSALGNTEVMQFNGLESYASELLLNNSPLLSKKRVPQNYQESFDCSSDLYHFNVMGMSGDFVLGSNGSVSVYNSSVPYGELKVRIEKRNDTQNNLKISITTSDGYTYVFGDTGQKMDFSRDDFFRDKYDPYSSVPLAGTDRLPASSAFRLTSIESPNGRAVEFFYSGVARSDLFCRKIYRPRINGDDNIDNEAFMSTTSSVFHNLDSIKVDGNTIVRFEYEQKSMIEDSQGSFSNADNCYRYDSQPSSEKLSAVKIYDRTGEIRDSISLHHSYTSPSSASPKMFLREVTSNLGKFSFEYNHSSPQDRYPFIDDVAADHWGYYRGSGTGLPFNPDTDTTVFWQTCQDNNLYNIPTGTCSPDMTYTIYGALTKITYPTGGYSEIEYEQNDAGKRMNRSINSGVFLENNYDHFAVGGVRVKNIIDYKKDGAKVDSTLYEYKTSNDNSSGIIQWMPRYAFKQGINYLRKEYVTIQNPLWLLDWNNVILPDSYGSCDFLTFNSQGVYSVQRGAHIGYSNVTAIRSDGSKVDYEFFDNETCCDIFGGVPEKLYPKGAATIPVNAMGTVDYYLLGSQQLLEKLSHLLSPVTKSLSCIRGKLLRTTEFDANGRKRREITNTYDIVEVSTRNQIHDILFCFAPYEISFMSPFLTEIISTEYFEDGTRVTTQKNMSYNDDGQLSSCCEFSNAGKIGIQTDYEYYQGSSGSSREHLLKSKKFYSLRNDDATEIYSLAYFYPNYSITGRNNPNPARVVMEVPDEASKELCLTYDNSSFRLTRADFPGGAYYKYIWDINNLYITEKETNGPAMKDQYVWLDLVGLAGHTDPYEHIETYTYDAKNRLQSVSMDGGKTVEYEYNVINQ